MAHDREQAIRAAISAQAHLRTALGVDPKDDDVWADVTRAEKAVDAYRKPTEGANDGRA